MDGTASQETEDVIGELRVLAEAQRDFSATWLALGTAATVDLTTGDIEEATECIARTRELADELLDPALEIWACVGEAALAQIRGDLAEVERIAARLLEVGNTSAERDAPLMYGAEMSIVRFWQGRTIEIVPVMRMFAAEARNVTSIVCGVALLLFEAGEVDEARAMVEDLLAPGVAALPHHTSWLAGIASVSDLCADLGLGQHAESIYDVLLPYRHLYASAGVAWWGSVERPLGRMASMLGRHDDALAHFEAAITAHERIGAHAWLSRTHVDYAAALLAVGRAADAAAQLDLADVIAARLGLAGVTARLTSYR
jgi:tetratricopeptide (TPR) repeat protein